MEINIQPYIDKLSVLKEYMDMKIDNEMPYSVWCGTSTTEDIIKLFFDTGILISRSNHIEPNPITFDDYYNRKVKNNEQNNLY